MSDDDPKLRHEFVGMMFAVTIGEVGLQVAALVHERHFLHLLPAYTHLTLATIAIAASWVGWSKSQSPGARKDVGGVFEPEFLVLLLDVFLVILYFILVRTVDFGRADRGADIGSAFKVSFIIFATFCVYIIWDLVTKTLIEPTLTNSQRSQYQWWTAYGVRIVPTGVCLGLCAALLCDFRDVDLGHAPLADVSLLGLVLLFRALKDIASARWPTPGKARRPLAKPVLVAFICGLIVLAGPAGLRWNVVPDWVVNTINTSIPAK